MWKDLLSQKVKGYWWEHGYTNTSLLNKQRDARASDTADSGLSTSLKGEKKLLKLYSAHAQALLWLALSPCATRLECCAPGSILETFGRADQTIM